MDNLETKLEKVNFKLFEPLTEVPSKSTNIKSTLSSLSEILKPLLPLVGLMEIFSIYISKNPFISVIPFYNKIIFFAFPFKISL